MVEIAISKLPEVAVFHKLRITQSAAHLKVDGCVGEDRQNQEKGSRTLSTSFAIKFNDINVSVLKKKQL